MQSSHEAPTRGPAAAGKTLQRALRTFPGLWFDVTRVVATEDVVVVSWQALARPWSDGSIAGVARRRARVEGCTVVGFRHGRVVRLWHYDEPLRRVTETSEVALAGID